LNSIWQIDTILENIVFGHNSAVGSIYLSVYLYLSNNKQFAIQLNMQYDRTVRPKWDFREMLYHDRPQLRLNVKKFPVSKTHDNRLIHSKTWRSASGEVLSFWSSGVIHLLRYICFILLLLSLQSSVAYCENEFHQCSLRLRWSVAKLLSDTWGTWSLGLKLDYTFVRLATSSTQAKSIPSQRGIEQSVSVHRLTSIMERYNKAMF